MCRTVHAILSTVICGIQMLVRVFMTIILMLENLIRMILQTLYNFISFMLQLFSLIPICVIFLVTTRLKCFMCGGGGPCPVNRGGACDCLMSVAALVLLFFIFRAVGLLDKIFYKLGYVEASTARVVRFVPTPGDVTECSRDGDNATIANLTTTTALGLRYDYTETETEILFEDTSTTRETTTQETTLQETTAASMALALTPMEKPQSVTNTIAEIFAILGNYSSVESSSVSSVKPHHKTTAPVSQGLRIRMKVTRPSRTQIPQSVFDLLADHNLTTVLYYLV